MNTCSKCKWWQEVTHQAGPALLGADGKRPRMGQCHLNPPAVAMSAPGQVSSILPPTAPDNFCSKFEEKPE